MGAPLFYFSQVFMPKRTIQLATILLCQCWLTLFIPMALLTYSPSWYEFNCQFHGRCDTLGQVRANERIDDLTQFWRHTGKLESIDWTKKEKYHLHEVRPLFDAAWLVSLVAITIFFIFFKFSFVKKTSLLIMAGLVTAGLFMPLFLPFWKERLHPWLFNNNAWKNTPFDTSYYLMPDTFFITSATVIIAIAFVINVLLYINCHHKLSLHLATSHRRSESDRSGTQ